MNNFHSYCTLEKEIWKTSLCYLGHDLIKNDREYTEHQVSEIGIFQEICRALEITFTIKKIMNNQFMIGMTVIDAEGISNTNWALGGHLIVS